MSADALALYGVTMGAAGCAAWMAFPAVQRLWERGAHASEQYQQAKAEKATEALEDLFIDVKTSRLKRLYGLAPLAAGFVIWAVFHSFWLAAAGAVAGIVLPDLWVRQARAKRNHAFRSQLVDALFIMSSSLKAGLSLIQALEVVQEEMDPPISQEFGLMIKAHRLGRTFEEVLQQLDERMPCEEVNLMTTTLLVGRETGGDVTGIITQLITTIRDKRKLLEKTSTLTLQGRLQAYIMSALPVGFVTIIQTFNPTYFNPLLGTALGRSLIVLAVMLWVVGMVVLLRMCKVEI